MLFVIACIICPIAYMQRSKRTMLYLVAYIILPISNIF